MRVCITAFSSRQLARRAASQRNLFIHRFCRLTQDIFHLSLCGSIRCRTRLPRLGARHRPIRHIRLYGNRGICTFRRRTIISKRSLAVLTLLIPCNALNLHLHTQKLI